MRKKTVAVLFGGVSSEHEISKISASTIINNISTDKYFVIPIYISKEGKWLLYDGCSDNMANVQWEKQGTPAILSPDTTHHGLLRIVGGKAKNIPIDMVFPVLHGKFGEDGSVQGLCELAGIPYVGSGILSSSACMDKAFTKMVAKTVGVAQADYLVFTKTDVAENMSEIYKKVRYKIGYPCFIKPSNGGSSIGISKANNKSELETALIEAAKHDNKVLIEKAIVGRELECAVLGNENPEASGVGEIVPSHAFYDFDAKYNDSNSETIVIADIPDEIKEEIRSSSLKIYKALDCSGLARIDFFYDTEKNRVVFNEVNTMPGFTAISMYSMLWKATGISISELVDKLIELGFQRFAL